MQSDCTDSGTADGKTFFAQKGDFWTYREGGTEGDATQGTPVAIMQVIVLFSRT